MFGIFAALAEFERELIRERTMAGLSSARATRSQRRPALYDDASQAAPGKLRADDSASSDPNGGWWHECWV